MSSDSSAKPILVAGAAGSVALLGAAWLFTASTSENAELEAQKYVPAAQVAATTDPTSVPEVVEAETTAAPTEEVTETAEATEGATTEDVAAAETEEPKAEEMAEAEAPKVEETAEAAPEATAAEEPKAEAETAAADAEQPAEAEKPADVEVAEATTTEPAAPAVAAVAGDAVKGEKRFRRCRACHEIGEGATNKIGPMLTGVVGRPMGGIEDYDYSDGFKAANAEGRIWTPAELDAWLTKPKDFMPGTKMAFGGLRKEEQRANVIAYLAASAGEAAAPAPAAEAEKKAEAEPAEAEPVEAVTETAAATTEPKVEEEAAPEAEATVTETETASDAAPAAAAAIVASVSGDVKKGGKVFRKCKACHQIGEGAKNRTGPMLTDIVGRTFGSVDGFKYSKVFVAANEEGRTWTPEELDAFLEKPKKYLPGTRMVFGGLRKEDDRANLIAYLANNGK